MARAAAARPATPTDPAAAPAPAAPPAPPPPAAARRHVADAARTTRRYADYTAGQYDLAIHGFEAFIRTFPKSDQADDAQVHIGDVATLPDDKYDKAVEAYDTAIRTYPAGDAIPEAYYQKGLALRHLGQTDRGARSVRVRRQELSRQRRRTPRAAELESQLVQAGDPRRDVRLR